MLDSLLQEAHKVVLSRLSSVFRGRLANKMAKTKVTKVSVEEELSTLKKHFGGIMVTFKALMEKV